MVANTACIQDFKSGLPRLETRAAGGMRFAKQHAVPRAGSCWRTAAAGDTVTVARHGEHSDRRSRCDACCSPVRCAMLQCPMMVWPSEWAPVSPSAGAAGGNTQLAVNVRIIMDETPCLPQPHHNHVTALTVRSVTTLSGFPTSRTPERLRTCPGGHTCATHTHTHAGPCNLDPTVSCPYRK